MGKSYPAFGIRDPFKAVRIGTKAIAQGDGGADSIVYNDGGSDSKWARAYCVAELHETRKHTHT